MADPNADGVLDPADLQRIPFLAGLSHEEVASLCSAAGVRALAEGEHVFHEGDPSRELYVILEGEVAIELRAGAPKPRLLATLDRGTVFGEINFLLGDARTADARALRATRLMVLDREIMDGLEGTGRQAVVRIMETLARVLALRLAGVDKEIGEFHRQLEAQHPDAAELTNALDDKKALLMHQWHF